MHAQKVELRVGDFTGIAPVVELEFTHLEIPVVVAGAAGGVDRIVSAVLVAPEKRHPFRAAARAVIGQQISGLEKRAGMGIEFEVERGAGEEVPLTVDAHIARRLQLIFHLLIADAVGLDAGAAFAQLGIAFDHGQPAGLARHFESLKKNGYRICTVAVGKQLGGGLERQHIGACLRRNLGRCLGLVLCLIWRWVLRWSLCCYRHLCR